MDENRQSGRPAPSLPASARLSINRCNLPSVVLGSLTYQQHPVALTLDGVHELHHRLIARLDLTTDADERRELFGQYMKESFLLDHPDEAGQNLDSPRVRRDKADYRRLLRGWHFDPDGIEAAVLKGWVESRFGLLPLNHHGPLQDTDSHNYQRYLAERSRGLYNTNALEAQIDLLYTYCQYEVRRQHPDETHVPLFRGINRIGEHEILHQPEKNTYVLVLNNLNSFTLSRERADEFGDLVIKARVPLAKLLFMPELLPHTMKGEREFLVIGGVYQVKAKTM